MYIFFLKNWRTNNEQRTSKRAAAYNPGVRRRQGSPNNR